MNVIPAALLFVASLLALPASAQDCRPASWVRLDPTGPAVVGPDALLDDVARREVVLLGETHDDADHHRWQLHTLAALHSRRPDMVLGFEMFPRSAQPVLERWVAGELSAERFLEEVRWDEVWSLPADLYLPLFEFARLHRIPMVALNVERQLAQAVAEKGWEGVPETEREGVSRPAPAPQAYLDELERAHREHASRIPFRNFVQAQQTWDRAMAQALASRRGRLAVGIVGSGHLRHGHGIALQLRDLGVGRIATLLPVDAADCGKLAPGLADAAFVLPSRADAKPPPPRLGVQLEQEGGVVRLAGVVPGSLAERSGLRQGDVIAAAAGKALRRASDLVALVREVPAGTWLPLDVRREGETRELVVKFPPRQ